MLHDAMDRRYLLLALGLLLAGGLAAVAGAAEPELLYPSDDCGFQRAGNPQCISRLARPSNGPGDTGYYVGGGAPLRGQPRLANEGTWGWDYSGLLFSRRIDLAWWHGARYQGGTGQYKTDGPQLGRH